jgi:hypothetical protein
MYRLMSPAAGGTMEKKLGIMPAEWRRDAPRARID